MKVDFLELYTRLEFLSDSVRMQYANTLHKKHGKFSLSELDQIVERLKANEPIEYVLNSADFFGHEFYVDYRCLIPRPETEVLVEKAIAHIEKIGRNIPINERITVLDIGTGSGCILISLALFFKKNNSNLFDRIDFIGVEISPEVLEVTKLNAEKFGLENHLTFVNKKFQDFDFSEHPNAVICANLPYIPNAEKLQESVEKYEPALALFGGEKGDELNLELLKILTPLENTKVVIMEGYNGKIEVHSLHK